MQAIYTHVIKVHFKTATYGWLARGGVGAGIDRNI
jgi:hypothetical protein